MTTRLLAFALLLVLPHASGAQAVEFEGVPTLKVEVREGKATTEEVASRRQSELQVRIVRDGDRYLWATRNNLPMLKQESGSYVTYTAVSGAGYVRVLGPALRSAIQQLPAEQRAREFIYAEHMLHQLGSVTYFGK
jgi:hypothetical protein